MKRYLLLLPLICILGGCPVPYTPPTPVSVTKKHELTTGTKYYIYVPSYYTKKRDWPLVITLHGSMLWDGPLRQSKEWKYYAEKHGLIVVAPSLCSAEGILPVLSWDEKLLRDERNVLAVLDEMCNKYRVDRRSVLLSGFSAGGYTMYYIGLRNPERFSMLISRAGNSSLKIFKNIEITKATRKLPIMLFWGKDDLPQIKRDGWKAFRWLRRHGMKKARMKKLQGGHLRRPEAAYRFWRPSLPKRHHMSR